MQDSEAAGRTAVVRPPEAAIAPQAGFAGSTRSPRTAVVRPLEADVAPRSPAWKVAAALAMGCLVLVAGAALGLVLLDDPQSSGPPPALRLASPDEIASEPVAATTSDATISEEAGAPDGPVVASAEPIPGAADPQYPAPVVTEEPAVAVAEALSPSVVRVEVDAPIGFGLGSGIVWDAQNGYIVTNQHVVEDVDDVVVTLSDGTRLDGEVVGGSSGHDVAVVRVDPGDAGLVAAPFAPASSVRVGQLAVAIGSPLGLTGTVTAGIVSAVRIQVQGGSDPGSPVPVEMIQTDAAINRGNSGGALADWQGRVIGMNTMIQTTSGGNIGLGFAVPSDTVDLIATRIVRGESLELGYLGISGQAADGDVEGVLVVEVLSASPAQEAGLLAGDVIVSLDSEPMKDIAELAAAIKLRRPGEAVEMTIRRGDDVYVATAVLDALG